MNYMHFATGLLICAILNAPPGAQSLSPIPTNMAKGYFAEAQRLCQSENGNLWGVSLCGPMMFVDPKTRSIAANQADADGVLVPSEGVYVGTLPTDQNIANTATEWSGTHWTEMLWPLPEERSKRDTLMGHELFHRIQNRLGFPNLKGGENSQLDTLEGRLYLQLEYRALEHALEASTDAERRQAATDALLFRAERYRLFSSADAQEAALEQNEGLAEYTGVRVGNPLPVDQTKAALDDLASQKNNSTFARSFAYATGPAYGLLLDRYDPEWRTQLRSGKSFGSMLQTALHVSLPGNTQTQAKQRAAFYGGAALRTAEIKRDAERQAVLTRYREQFVSGPVLILTFQHMHVQFDPRNLQPLEGIGTVYPNLRISDDWGILEASKGALLKPDWSAVIVTAPPIVDGSNVQGTGWTLKLNPGWKLVPSARPGDFMLRHGS